MGFAVTDGVWQVAVSFATPFGQCDKRFGLRVESRDHDIPVLLKFLVGRLEVHRVCADIRDVQLVVIAQRGAKGFDTVCKRVRHRNTFYWDYWVRSFASLALQMSGARSLAKSKQAIRTLRRSVSDIVVNCNMLRISPRGEAGS